MQQDLSLLGETMVVQTSNATDRQAFNFIVEYKMANDGNSPTFAEIAQHMGMSETGIRYTLYRLQDTGLITLSKGETCSTANIIKVTGGTWTPPDLLVTAARNNRGAPRGKRTPPENW